MTVTGNRHENGSKEAEKRATLGPDEFFDPTEW